MLSSKVVVLVAVLLCTIQLGLGLVLNAPPKYNRHLHTYTRNHGNNNNNNNIDTHHHHHHHHYQFRDYHICHSTAVEVDPSHHQHSDRIIATELEDELKASFMSYAMSTILGRALPDARDGLKPVHRRVLYAMQVLNLTPDSGYRKCARVVGEVLGKFHPHGDQSVYDALVRMAQDFVTLHPLVNGHGNFGSIDDDPPAAMRYTEAKLSNLAYDALLADIKENTVDFTANFDGNEEEPLVLPAKLPMLLLNGASGIAVGMATNIPPHNLGELCDGVMAIIKNPKITDDELFKIIPAPDFPTGGKIMGLAEARKFYSTGRGSIVLRGNSHIEELKQTSKGINRSKNAIIVTELPYMVNKAALLEKIADLVNDKKLEGISDLRDESDRDGIRVVIELKRDAVPSVVQNNLYKKTQLQTTFSGNSLALVNDGKQPQRITLRENLDIFIKFRFETVRRRSSNQLEKLKTRDHVVLGLMKALSRIDDIISVIRKSKDKDNKDAKEIFMSPEYGLSSEQVESILGLRLSRLSGLEEKKLKEEHDDLTKQIEYLTKVMSDDKLVYGIMEDETKTLKAKHAVPRKSVLWQEEAALSDIDLINNERSVMIMTHSGYIKRIPAEEFQAQSRGGRGKAGTKLSSDEDTVSHFFSCNDHDAVLFITDKGIAYSIKAFQVPKASRHAKGVPLPQVLPISSEETVTSVIPIDTFGENEYLVLLTSGGFVKKTPLKAFATISARGLIIISLGAKDSLKWARRCKPNEEIIIATKDGHASRFSEADVTSTGRTSRGSTALSLREGDTMTDMDILPPSVNEKDEANPTSFLLAVTAKGYGKRIPIPEFLIQRRRGKGVIAIKFKDKVGGGGKAARVAGKLKGEGDELKCMRVCSVGDEIVLSTAKGTIIRQRVDDLSIQSRTATGVSIQRIDKDDEITMVDIIPAASIPQDSTVDETPQH